MACRALGHPLTIQNGLAILPLLALLASRLSLEDMTLSRRVLQLVLEQPAVSAVVTRTESISTALGVCACTVLCPRRPRPGSQRNGGGAGLARPLATGVDGVHPSHSSPHPQPGQLWARSNTRANPAPVNTRARRGGGFVEGGRSHLCSAASLFPAALRASVHPFSR
jgi:hypothetical protein